MTRERGSRIAIALVAAIGCACIASVASLPKLRIDPKLTLRVPSGRINTEAEAANALFPEKTLIIASLPVGDPLSPRGLRRLADASSALEAEGHVDAGETAAWDLVSPLTVHDIAVVGDSLQETPLVDGAEDDPERVRARFASSPLFSNLFLSKDGRCWTFVLQASIADGGLLDRLEAVRAAIPEIQFAGLPYSSALNGRTLQREFFAILVGIAAALLLAEYLMFRRFRTALLLWIFSLAPAVLLLGIMIVTGTSLRLHLALAPGLALCLSTSYVVHIYHGWLESGRDAISAVREKGRLVALDAATTVLGFSSLLVSPLMELREISAFAILAAIIPLATTLLGLASILYLASPSGPHGEIFRVESSIRPPTRRRRVLIAALWAVSTAALSIATQGLRIGIEPRWQYPPGSPARSEIDHFARSYAGLEEIGVLFETGEEYGLVDPRFFGNLLEYKNDILGLPLVGAVHGYTDAVGEVSARLRGNGEATEPVSANEIGEALELLTSRREGSFIDSFVDVDWSAARLRLSMSPSFNPTRDIGELRSMISAAARRHGLPVPLLSGISVKSGETERLFIESQVSGDVLFFVFLIAGLALVFRSVRKAIVVAAAPATGFVASLAIMAILGWPLSSVHAVALAVVLGTGVDNAIMLALGDWTGDATLVSAEAALLITCGFTAFLASSSFIMIQMAIVCIAGLAASTIVANTLVPALLQPDRSLIGRANGRR